MSQVHAPDQERRENLHRRGVQAPPARGDYQEDARAPRQERKASQIKGPVPRLENVVGGYGPPLVRVRTLFPLVVEGVPEVLE